MLCKVEAWTPREVCFSRIPQSSCLAVHKEPFHLNTSGSIYISCFPSGCFEPCCGDRVAWRKTTVFWKTESWAQDQATHSSCVTGREWLGLLMYKTRMKILFMQSWMKWNEKQKYLPWYPIPPNPSRKSPRSVPCVPENTKIVSWQQGSLGWRTVSHVIFFYTAWSGDISANSHPKAGDPCTGPLRAWEGLR